MMKRYAAILIILLLSSCVGNRSHFKKIESSISNRDYGKSVELVEKSKGVYGKKNRVLYYMDLGWAYHLNGDIVNSNKAFKRAENYIDELFTKSLTKETSAKLMNNNNVLDFEGEDFEKVSINIFRALGYAYNGNLEDAVIEARKVNKRLKILNSNRKQRRAYLDDAFARYLSGILYESQKEYNNAYISYYKAYRAYKAYGKLYNISLPNYLKSSIKRLYEDYAGGEKDQLENELSSVMKEDTSNKGRLVFIHYNGYAPKKEEKWTKVYPRDYGKNDYEGRMSIGYPEFKIRNRNISYAIVNINGSNYSSQLVHPIEQIAIRNLKDRLVLDFPKMILAKAARKLIGTASGKALKSDNDAVFLLGMVGAVASVGMEVNSDRADLRSWRTIPAEISLVDVFLEPGNYNVSIDFCDSYSNVIEQKSFNVDIKARKQVFKWYKTVR